MSEVATIPTAIMCSELEHPRARGRVARQGGLRWQQEDRAPGPLIPVHGRQRSCAASAPGQLSACMCISWEANPRGWAGKALCEVPCRQSNGGQPLLATLLFHSSVPVALNGNFSNYFCLVVQSRLRPCSLKPSVRASVLLFWFPLPLIPMDKEFVVYCSLISNIYSD